MSAHLHVVVPDLFPPKEFSPAVFCGLRINALEIILARANPEEPPGDCLEQWLCAMFGVSNGSIAPVTLRAEGLAPAKSYWLRADPVHLEIGHDGAALRPACLLDEEEAAWFCADLNAHFSGAGMELIAPHPERWYLRLEQAPMISTQPISMVSGRDVRGHLPQGGGAPRWHGILNEMQMLLHSHPVNEARQARGELPVNSVWLWGGGYDDGVLRQPFSRVLTDSPLAMAFAAAAHISHATLSGEVPVCPLAGESSVLVVWDGLRRALQHGDVGSWRDELQRLEQSCVEPALNALRDGVLDRITLDVPQGRSSARLVLTRRAAWKFWRRGRLADHGVE